MNHCIPTLILSAALTAAAPAATVLTNLSGAVTASQLIKGTGGFLPAALELGFEFTVAGGEHDLVTITLGIGAHSGSLPILVELYGSPSGPDSATFITHMTGLAQPVNQQAAYAPATPTVLTDGGTYFVRMWVNGAASTYGIQKTTDLATGTFTMGNNYSRSAGSSWGAGAHVNEPVAGIIANPVPEATAVMLAGLGFMLLLLGRWR